MYVVPVKTESGDEFYYLWENKPTKDQVFAAIRRDMPDEFDDANNENYIGYWDAFKTEIEE